MKYWAIILCQQKMNIQPIISNYLLFRHRTDERGNLDPVMSHGSCAVLHGMNLGIKRNIGWNEVDNQSLQTIKN